MEDGDSAGAPSLGALQRELEVLLAKVRHPRIGAGLALAEEAGEVCKLVLDAEVYGKAPAEGALAGELVDVLICVCELASQHGVNLDQAVAEKLRDLTPRVRKWEETLGPALAAARARMDG